MRGFCLLAAAGILLAGCSFDYGNTGDTDNTKPDIVMDDLNYVRVRGGDPLVSFKAEHAERYEGRQAMEIKNFSFEQLQNGGKDINAEGRAGSASVQLNSGDISLKDGVKINVASEDITIWTGELQWKDKEKTLSGNVDDEVDIDRSDGTSFTGKGFFADARNRTWTFSGQVNGKYVEKEDNKKDKKKTEASGTNEDQTPVQQVSAPEESASPPVVNAHEANPQEAKSPDVNSLDVNPPDQYPEPKPSIPALSEDK